MTFAAALRQLCERFGLQCSRQGMPGTYLLQPSAAPLPPRPIKRVGLVQKSGVSLFLRRIDVSQSRRIDFEAGPAQENPGAMSLWFQAELGDRSTDEIAWLENVAARDDRGNLLVSQGRSYGPSSFFGPGFPDEWSGAASLPAPDPRARKLAWVEGDLMIYRFHRPLSFEIPLPVLPGGTQVAREGIVVELLRYEQADQQAAGVAGPPARPQGEGTLHFRISLPSPEGAGQGRLPQGFSPVLVDASGRHYRPSGLSTSGRGGPNGTIHEVRADFWEPPDEPVKALLRIVRRDRVEPLLRFRMADIPLPPEPVFHARRGGPPASPPGAAVRLSDRPFHDPDGGALVTSVRILGKPPLAGTLLLGLAEKRAGPAHEGDPAPVRWLDVPVDEEGTARLEALRPGTYRLLRIYQPGRAPGAEGHPQAGPGAWRGAETEVTVTAGKDVAVPPLAWERGVPEARPAAAGRKPAKATPAPAARKAPTGRPGRRGRGDAPRGR